jgi:hypothetical protein
MIIMIVLMHDTKKEAEILGIGDRGKHFEFFELIYADDNMLITEREEDTNILVGIIEMEANSTI